MIFINNDFFIAFLAGILLDLIFGDPNRIYHPVRMIGNLISFLEKRLLKTNDKNGVKRAKGALLSFLVIILTGLTAFFVIFICKRISRVLAIVVMGIMAYFSIAAKSLRDAAMAVYRPLNENEDVEKARSAVSMIVGRDTKSLDESGIIRACVETVAENTNDGVICPLFYLAIGGPVLVWIYKAVSTMDSMIGYKNDKYRYFGTAAAKLDDAFAFIPARISAICMIAAAFVLRYDFKNAVKIFKRDRYNHESHNSAQCESVCAGALDLKLAGPTSYFGKTKDKPYIGDDIKSIDKADILRSIRLMFGTEIVFVFVFILITVIII